MKRIGMWMVNVVAVAMVLNGVAWAQPAWDAGLVGIVGGSLPLKVNGLKISDPTVPLDLTSDGGVNRKAPVFGGGVRIFKTRTQGFEVGLAADVRTFRYDGEAGHPTRLRGTIEGQRIDEIQMSEADRTRVTMALAAVLVRLPMGRSASFPSGRWAPYVGVGGGNQHANITQPASSFTTNAATVQALAGVTIHASRRIGIFGEYRYEHLKDTVIQGTTTVNITLRTNHLAGGVVLRF